MRRQPTAARLASWRTRLGVAYATISNVRIELGTHYDPTDRVGDRPGDPPADSDDDTIDMLHRELGEALESLEYAALQVQQLAKDLDAKLGAA